MSIIILLYMRSILICIIFLSGCVNDDKKVEAPHQDSISTPLKDIPVKDTVVAQMPVALKIYTNTAFKKVIVEKISPDSFRVKGMARIFEANFSWVVEDGHEEIKKGYQMTDAGAPEWGKFDFKIRVSKKRENSTLTLLLFESSAEDGRRLHELVIPLR